MQNFSHFHGPLNKYDSVDGASVYWGHILVVYAYLNFFNPKYAIKTITIKGITNPATTPATYWFPRKMYKVIMFWLGVATEG